MNFEIRCYKQFDAEYHLRLKHFLHGVSAVFHPIIEAEFDETSKVICGVVKNDPVT